MTSPEYEIDVTDETEKQDTDPTSLLGETTPEGPRAIGRYQLCFELASGGMAKVYLGRVEGPAGFEKLVAIKRIHDHLADQSEFVEMFLDEARIASRINHPNVCAVFDFGQADGTFYIAMEYMLGETLARVVKHASALSELAASSRWFALVARIISEASEGLHAAHELRDGKGERLNVVHRDVSLHNLFVNYDGTVKVMDFGIARAADRLHTTQAGRVKGRYAYMAPEQAAGLDVDRRADIWSLGVCLWELLTCRRLFRRDTEAETIMAVSAGTILRPREVSADVPQAFEDIVMRALARDKEDRYVTAREMGKDLNRALVDLGEPVGKAELADMMSVLFEDRQMERLRMIEVARLGASGPVRKAPVDEALANPLEAVSVTAPVGTMGTVSGTRRKVGRSPRTWLALVIGVLGGVGLTLAVTLFVSRGDPVEPHATGPAATAPGEERPRPPPEPIEEEPVAPPAGTMEETPAPEPPPTPPAVEPPTPEQAAIEPAGERAAEKQGGRDDRPIIGTVNVVTPGGWADVYHNGRRIGRTPASVRLPIGRQNLSLRPFGELPARRVSIQVSRDRVGRVSVPVSR